MISNPLAALVKRSPLLFIQEHMRSVLGCARLVPSLLERLCEEDTEEFESIKNLISEKENDADLIKNSLRGRLPKSLFMPIDRRDLLEVLHIQDSIADTSQDVGVFPGAVTSGPTPTRPVPQSHGLGMIKAKISVLPKPDSPSGFS